MYVIFRGGCTWVKKAPFVVMTFSFPRDAANFETQTCSGFSVSQKDAAIFSAISSAILWWFSAEIAGKLAICNLRFENVAILLRLRLFWTLRSWCSLSPVGAPDPMTCKTTQRTPLHRKHYGNSIYCAQWVCYRPVICYREPPCVDVVSLDYAGIPPF